MVVPNSLKKERTLKLIEEKDRIEKKIADYGRILEINKNVGMTESLVDEEEFPRNDIDVHQVRHARHQIICLQNDLKELMKQIQKGIEEIHAEAASSSHQGLNEATSSNYSAPVSEMPPLESFVCVNFVSPGSPAEDAGLMMGDEILEFGSINSKNFKDLTMIAELVKNRENQKIIVKIKRGREILENRLVPQKWSGRGLLGCNLVKSVHESIER
uniref:26S proteasome non-ATPase regulatory subunit 9 n=1 Tax=Tabanus bromius TaxID=304241 RepID=A0A0K8TRU9_TABBR